MAFPYPPVKRENVKEDYHGTTVEDPYRWLEDPDSEETQKVIAEQDTMTRNFLKEYAHRDEINKSVTNMWNYPKCSPPYKHGEKYFQYRNTGLQNQNVVYIMDNLEDAEGKVFLDPNVLSSDGTVALSSNKFSKDGSVFAYGLTTSGSDWTEIKFKDTKTGKDYDEVLKKVKFSSMSWMHDHIGFFYCAYLDQLGKHDGSETVSSENQKLYYHRLGTDQSKDIVVVEFDDPQLRIGGTVSYCGQYLIVTACKGCKNNLLYFSKLSDKITGKLELTPVVSELEADYDYITNTGSKFLFHTNKNAPNYRLISIDLDKPEESNWTTLIEEHEKDVLDWAKSINHDQLVVCYLQDVKNTLALHNLHTGEKIQDFPISLGTVSSMAGRREDSEMFYGFVSFLTPNTIYKVDLTDNKVEQTLFYRTKVGDFDPSKYVTKQEFFTSKDGTKVPMFIIHKTNFVMDGSKPCLLYGYGGFNISVSPSFSVARLLFVNHFDGCCVVANIRGGGEYGDKWHNGGRFENKQNCFDDFQWAAKHVIAQKYTNSSNLTIMGGSNGGLLVAACINQAPELFSTAICQVGVLDMLRFHKFTIGYAWKSDYGSSEKPDEFNYLYKYSPLHNVREPEGDIQYPSTLLLTADHDDRVVALHSLKFIAELQWKVGSLPKQKNPLMVRVETRIGHGAGKPTTKLIEEITDILCFIAKTSNLKFYPN